jgi:hypothetical protein
MSRRMLLNFSGVGLSAGCCRGLEAITPQGHPEHGYGQAPQNRVMSALGSSSAYSSRTTLTLISRPGLHHQLIADRAPRFYRMRHGGPERTVSARASTSGVWTATGARWACPIVTAKEATMPASVGDRVCVRGHSVGSAERQGEVRSIQGPDGSPPFVVLWDDGHEGVFFPGPDAEVRPMPSAPES